MAAALDPDLLDRARRGDRAAVDTVLATMSASTRASRARPSRRAWRLALVAGALGLIGFTLLLLTSSSHGPPSSTPSATTGRDFPFGILMGLVAGVAIGWTLGRSRRDAR